MKVKNRRIIGRLSLRSLKASAKRNIIAVIAIILTTVLFTTLFTIALSMNSSYETYTFRQIGGYVHGTFKEVSSKQIKEISAHKKIKEAGERLTIGTISEGVFAKVPAELSYMDENTAKWSYIDLEEGHAPKKENEIIMDDKALKALGIRPQPGAEIELTYDVNDKTESMGKRTDTFVLSGWWKSDDLCPVHFLNVSKAYALKVEKEAMAQGKEAFRRDLNVMLSSSMNIKGTMEAVEKDLGYQNKAPEKENYVGTGVNWGYVAAQTDSIMTPQTALVIAVLILLVIFTGYLIIYNIFQISVAGDIRYYGLLKTIGVTSRQLRKIIRQQAMLLCLIGCPIGLLLGYLAGYVLTPVILSQTTMADIQADISASPLIFVGAALFSVVTVMLSCKKPGRLASKVSPVEAAKYTEGSKVSSAKRKRTRRAGIYQMAFANLGRNKVKTALVIISLSLSVVLLSILTAFVGGFSMEKYLSSKTCADFIVGKTEYFRFEADDSEDGVNKGLIEQIEGTVKTSAAGEILALSGEKPITKVRGKEIGLQMEGLDEELIEKLNVFKGDLKPLFDPGNRAIAIGVDVNDYGKPYGMEKLPKVGDKINVSYVDEGYYIDSRTGEKSTAHTPEEYIKYHVAGKHDVEYTVCAIVEIPYQMSFRYSGYNSCDAVLSADRLREDSKGDIYPLMYMFDTPDRESEKQAEKFLADITKGDTSGYMYESKALVREEFRGFKHMFTLLGGVLCTIVGLVGILNFFNGIMTGILSRRRELAMLQSIGMTGKQLKKMLILEGVFYAAATIIVSAAVTLAIGPLAGSLMEKMFWFYEYHFTAAAIIITAPVFLLMGVLLPIAVYRRVSKKTVVERLRENE